jgi:hypothetical protein
MIHRFALEASIEREPMNQVCCCFPNFRPGDLVRFLKMGASAGETQMLRAFREWIRERKKTRR